MKLELKHIAPYLPYELGIHYKSLATQYLRADTLHLIDLCLNRQWKPILRPLSDLTKEINGKCYWLLIEETEMRYFRVKNSQIDKLCVKTYNNLLENHFDVFGLIDKGLAIDINTLKENNK